MVFKCINKTTRKTERWEGKITYIKKYGSHYEMMIQSRSSILLLFGKTTQGGFACMPDFRAGCHLVSLKDKFWNTEKLTAVLGKVDGITAAEALFTIADIIEKGDSDTILEKDGDNSEYYGQ